jgi:hypothetical protein
LATKPELVLAEDSSPRAPLNILIDLSFVSKRRTEAI